MIDLIERWQTLIAGLLAIVAALIGGRYINRQIQASANIEEDRRKRKFAASRAVLPLTLSSLSEYARRCSAYLKDILATRNGEAIPLQSTPTPPPLLPITVIEELRSMIEYSDEPIRGALVRLVSKIQEQTARLTVLANRLRKRPNSEELVTVSNIEEYMLDAAEIYARCAALFSFARAQSEEVPGDPSIADIRSALNQTSLWQENFARLHERVGRKY